MNETERLRRTFRPSRITTLFVGESPPHGGTFFYDRNSGLYHAMKKSFGAAENFLEEFKAKGFYLDDLALYPINQIKDDDERDVHRCKAVPSLAERMADYRPAAVVALMCALKPMVEDAIREAGLSNVPLYVTPFPGRYTLKRFRAKMAEIIPKLPVAKVNH